MTKAAGIHFFIAYIIFVVIVPGILITLVYKLLPDTFCPEIKGLGVGKVKITAHPGPEGEQGGSVVLIMKEPAILRDLIIQRMFCQKGRLDIGNKLYEFLK